MSTRIAVLLVLGMMIVWPNPAGAQKTDKLVVLPLQDQTTEQNGGIETIRLILEKYFGRSDKVDILNEDQLQSLLGSETGNRESLTRIVAEKAHSNKVLSFTLERYRQRVGSDLSITDAASLAFKFRLYNAPEGKMLCSGRFDETQKSLSENILDFSQARKRGFKWITVEEMAEKAIPDRLDRCQDIKDLSTTK